MANRILNIETNITSRATGLANKSIVEPVKKDINYTLFTNDILRFKDTDNQVTIPLGTLTAIKFIRLEARYIQDDATALPSPVKAGDFAPFKVRLDGQLFDIDCSGGIFEKHGSVNALEVSTDYDYAQIELITIICG